MEFRPYLVPLYAAATLFPRALSLPSLPETVQFTELFFPLALWSFRREVTEQVRRYRWLSLALAGYLLANFISATVAGSMAALVEAGARVYLGLLAYIVLAHVECYGIRSVASWWRITTAGVAVACILTYMGLLLGLSGPGGWIVYVPDYPIFGTVYRLRGTATVFGMMYMLLLPGLLLCYARLRAGRGSGAIVVLILLAAAVTLAKENVLFFIGAVLLELRHRATSFHGPLLLVAAGLVGFLLLSTHFLVQPRGQDLMATIYTSGRTVYTGEDYVIAETNYTANKRAALIIGRENPWFGVGPGRFQDHTDDLVLHSQYPAHFGRFNPHSAWTGAFAETGLLGLLGLIALVASLLYYRPAHWTVAAVLLLLFLVASVFKDVMNFRGLWVLVGLYLAGTTAREVAGVRV